MQTKLTLLIFACCALSAHACSGCFAGASDDSRKAFIATTLFMTSLPLIMGVALTAWLYRKHKKRLP